MSDLPAIELPAELLPTDGRFGSGPSKIRTESVLELAVSGTTYLGTSHRRPAVRDVIGSIRRNLAALFALPDDHLVAMGLGGATAFWDLATFSLIRRRSEHLVFGEFSGKFADAVRGAPHLDAPFVVESDPGSRPEPIADDDIDLLALTHNETSTGVAMPVARPEGMDPLVVVDGTSAAGAMPVDPTECDVYYFSPQKVFGAEGGLWLAWLSPRAIQRTREIVVSDRWIPPFLSLSIAVENARRDQTYNTPALATLFLLARQIEWMLDMGGVEWAASRSQRSSAIVYRWAEASAYAAPFVIRPEFRSSTVTTIDLEDAIPASVVSGVLRANGIVDTEGYRKLGRNQLRVATFPNVEPTDVERLVGAIDHIVERL